MRKTILTVVVMAVAATGIGIGAPAQAAPCMQFGRIQYNTPGDDLPVTNAKLNREYVTIQNTCSRTITISRWQLRDRDGHAYRFPTTKVAGQHSIVVHTGKGTNDRANRYWGHDYYIWNNSGDRARLWHGTSLVDQCSWGSGSGTTNC